VVIKPTSRATGVSTVTVVTGLLITFDTGREPGRVVVSTPSGDRLNGSFGA